MNTKKYNKSMIMKRAWKLYNAQEIRTMEAFSASLTKSWNIEKNGMAEIDIDKIYNKHYKQVFNMVLNRVNLNRSVAEELTNDVFVRFEAKLNYDVKKSAITTILFTIAKNIVIDYYRSSMKKKNEFNNIGDYTDDNDRESLVISSPETANSGVESKEASREIAKAFRNLKPQYRRIATMYFLREYSYGEICAELDMSLGSVKGTISRIRTTLQEQLKTLYNMAY